MHTLSRWRKWIPQLHAAAAEHLPVALSLNPDPELDLPPPGWDDVSFAEHLARAAIGDFRDVSICGSSTIVRYSGPTLFVSPQKKLYAEIFSVLHSPDDFSNILATLSRRISKLFAPFEIDFTLIVNLEHCIKSLNLVQVPVRVKVIKTWLNAWATTNRIKGDFSRDCLLGCANAPDSLAHYLNCPRVFACSHFVVPSSSDDPLIRCGLCMPTRVSLLITACTFSAYHALKAKINSKFDARLPEDVDMIPYWVFFAQSFAAEAVAFGLSRQHFDPHSFLSRFLDEPTN